MATSFQAQQSQSVQAAAAPSVVLLHDTGALDTDRITKDAQLSLSALATGSTRSFVIVQDGTAGTSTTSYVPPAVSGVYTVYVTDTDANGIAVTSAITFTLDVNAPPAPTLSLLHDTGASTTDLFTRDGTLAFTGAESGGLIEFFVVPTGSGTGSWTTTMPSFTTDGSYSILVRQTDLAGNVATSSSTFTFTLDTTAPIKPTVTLTNDANNDHVIDTDGLTVTGVETGGVVEYSLDSGTTWSKTQPDKLVNGDYKVQVRVTDLAGNVSAIDEVSFKVAKLVPAGPDNPTITNDSGASHSDGITNDIPTITADNLPAGSTLEFQLDGTTTWVKTLPTSLVDGGYTVHIRVMASNGSVSTDLDDVTFTLDRAAPTALAATLTNGTATGGTTTVTGVPTFGFGSSNEAGAEIEFSTDDGVSWLSLTDLTGLKSGTYSILFHQVDLAGNVSGASNAVAFAIAAPGGTVGDGVGDVGGLGVNDGRDGLDGAGLGFGAAGFGLF